MTAASCQSEQLLHQLARTPVEDRARVLRQAGDVSHSLASLIDLTARMTMTDAAQAVEASAMVVNLADRVGSQLDRARARRARARALSYANQFEDALLVAREGARLAEESGHAIEAGRARLASMHALGEMGRLDEAIRIGEHARESFLAAGEPALAARADINIGTAHQRRDDPVAAVACFERAKPHLRDDALVLGHLENNRGEALLALNRFPEAQEAFNAALIAFQHQGATLTAAIAEGNLADLAARQGLLPRALKHYERARRQMETDRASGHLARLIAEQAESLSVLGMAEEALVQYKQALAALDQSGLTLEAARARYGMGQALLRLYCWTDAETALAAAAQGFDALGHAAMRAKTDLARAQVAAAQLRLDDAKSLALRALAVLHDRPVDGALARLVLGLIAFAQGRSIEARAELDLALVTAQTFDLAPLLADIHAARSDLFRQLGDLDQAIENDTQAVHHVERLRGSLQAERFRTSLLGDRVSVYERLVRSLLDRSSDEDVKRAFVAAELAKSRSLLDVVQGLVDETETSESLPYQNSTFDTVIDDDESSSAELHATAARLRAELNTLYSCIDDRRSHAQPTDAVAWTADVHRRERELSALETRLGSLGNIDSAFARPLTITEVQSTLSTDTALVEYFIAQNEVLAFVIRHDAVHVTRRVADASMLPSLLNRIDFQINRALRPGALSGARQERLLNDMQRELKTAYALLMEPIADDLASCTRLVIVPHGTLHRMPFHALFDGSRYVTEQFEVLYVPSAGLWTHVWQNAQRHVEERARVHDAVVVGVSDEHAPHIAHESAVVSRILHAQGCRSLEEDHATVAAVRAAARGATILHLACHGRFAPHTPMASGLKLADGWLTLRDIYGLNLPGALVTLSGCQTGVSSVTGGDELTGLLRAFLAAGARSLLVSQWRVDDVVTAEMMSSFYGALITHTARSTSQALCAAQQFMLTKHPHPALWASFVLVGGGDNP